jgi:sugar/nucleoside kinase (ribokinase family)
MTGPAARPKIAVAGYLSLDTLHCPAGIFEEVVGGGALYAALGAAAAGGDVSLVARAGHDFPRWALDRLAALGIRLDALERAPTPSRRSELIEPSARLGCVSHRRTPAYARSQWWERTRELAPVPLERAVDAYVVTPMPAALALRHARLARRRGALAVADTSEAFAQSEPEAVLALAAEVDVFAPSREEVQLLFPGETDSVAHAKLGEITPIVVQKRGASGYWLLVRGRPPSTLASRATQIADATGAGDASVGALAAGLARGLTPEAALALAADVAARTVTAVGAAGLGLRATAAVVA